MVADEESLFKSAHKQDESHLLDMRHKIQSIMKKGRIYDGKNEQHRGLLHYFNMRQAKRLKYPNRKRAKESEKWSNQP